MTETTITISEDNITQIRPARAHVRPTATSGFNGSRLPPIEDFTLDVDYGENFCPSIEIL